jgi:hypothetical protein
MREIPIIMGAESVRAILEGRKTQTRRVVTGSDRKMLTVCTPNVIVRDLPKYYIGDRLWVRETWALVPTTAYRCSDGIIQTIDPNNNDDAYVYKENFDRAERLQWKSPMFMPRFASRITLEVTDIRIERLQDISEEDALAEGMYGKYEGPNYKYGSKREGVLSQYRRLWDSHNAKRGYSWKQNPWVWVVEFKVVK